MSDSELDLQRSFGRLEAKVDALIDEVRASGGMHTARIIELEKRVESLERWKTWLIAYSSGVGATVVLVGVLVWRAISVLR